MQKIGHWLASFFGILITLLVALFALVFLFVLATGLLRHLIEWAFF